MAGIYVHIPFCKSKCNYCDFCSGTQLHLENEFTQALIGEIDLRKDYLSGNKIDTIYFGGGTPSLLSIDNFNRIVDCLRHKFDLDTLTEFTIECNPDDIQEDLLRNYQAKGVNRLSIGVQSFNDRILSFFGRIHSGKQAIDAIELSKKVGFTKLTADFIFAVPGFGTEELIDDLKIIQDLNINHLSFYNLTIAEGTKLYWKVLNREINEFQEKETLDQFMMIYNYLVSSGLRHYEISNYAVPGYESIHNTNYWNNVSYLGLGPGAHSFNGKSRQWNLQVLKRYIKNIEEGKGYFEIEYLSDINRFNEYIITNLRTYQGLNLDYIRKNFSHEICSHFLKILQSLNPNEWFHQKDDTYIPTLSTLLKADFIAGKFIL